MDMSDFAEEEQEIVTDTEENFKILTSNSESPSSNDSQNVIAEYEEIQPKARYDSEIIQEILSKSKRFKNISHEGLLQIIGEPQNFGYLKKMAVSRLKETIRQQFAVFSQIMNKKVHEDETIQNDRLSQGVFSWRWSDFIERRQQESFVWVDILLRKKEKQLHYLKFRSDLNELQFFLSRIFEGFLFDIGEQQDVEIEQSLATIIEDAQKTLHILDNVEKEYHMNLNELRYIIYKEYLFADAKRFSEERVLKHFLENRICNSHIMDPIEIRYHMGWFDSLVKQNQCNIENITQMYQADATRFKELENVESFTSGSCLDYYYSSTELYKSRINEIQNKFDKENDEMETKLTLLRLQIEKTKEQRNWLLSEIQRFRDEVQEVLEGGLNEDNEEEK